VLKGEVYLKGVVSVAATLPTIIFYKLKSPFGIVTKTLLPFLKLVSSEKASNFAPPSETTYLPS
jgi:hypothetical protein